MKDSFLRFCILLGLLSTSVGQETVPEAAQPVFEKYQDAEAKVVKPLFAMEANYRKHLEKMLSKNKASGNLEVATELQAEIDAVDNDKVPSTAAKDPELQKARSTFLKARSTMLKSNAPRQLKLLKVYQEQLQAMAKNLTQSGKLKEAKVIADYILTLDPQVVKFQNLIASKGGTVPPAIDWRFIESGIDSKKLKDTELRAQVGGSPYRVVTEEPAILVGFRFAMSDMNDHRTVRGAQAIFRGMDGKDNRSDEVLGFKKPVDFEKVVAKENYAVGGMEFQIQRAIRRVRVHFYRIDGKKLNPADSYSSEWFGEWPEGSDEYKVDSGTKIPVGVQGRHGLGLDAIGLVLLSE